MIRAFVLALAALALGACGQTYEEKQAEALAAEPRISPGIYGNVRTSAETGDRIGIELELRQGSDSPEIRLVICEGECNAGGQAPVTRGLGGVAFTITYADRPIDMTVQPDGADAVVLSADWGNGLEQQRLPRVPGPTALDALPSG